MRNVVSHVTFGCGPTYEHGTMASRKQNKAEFTWTEHEAELLLNIIHDYKIKQFTVYRQDVLGKCSLEIC